MRQGIRGLLIAIPLCACLLVFEGTGKAFASEPPEMQEEIAVAPEDNGNETPESQPVSAIYPDVNEKDWFYPALQWCQEEGLLQDIPLENTFQSDTPVTRAMLTSMLARLVNSSLSWTGAPVYTDVQPEACYYEPVSWAGSVGLASGYGDGTFGLAPVIS